MGAEKALGSLKPEQGFGTVDILARYFFVVGAALCIVGSLATSLASAHQVPVAPPS